MEGLEGLEGFEGWGSVAGRRGEAKLVPGQGACVRERKARKARREPL